MISINDIMIGINKLIVAEFPPPDYTIYPYRCPKNFARPSFLFQYVKSSKRDVNRSTIERTVFF